MKGKIKFFNELRGFGFISGEDNVDYFVHKSNIDDYVNLVENDEVEFETEETDRGVKAINVRKSS